MERWPGNRGRACNGCDKRIDSPAIAAHPERSIHSPREAAMPKFLIQASYTAEGLKGLQKEGAASRAAGAAKLAAALGGKCEAFYWSFGEQDVVAIFDVPSAVDATAMAITVSATGAIRTKTTPLLTASETDAALKKTLDFHAPGR
jgi:uncharacterized protein with GYD domain